MKAHLKYFFALLISGLFIAFPLITFVTMIFSGFQIWSIVLFALTAVIPLAFKEQFQKLRIITRRNVDYDEFGRSKRKGFYEKLSQSEKDQIDLAKTAYLETIISTSALKKMTKSGSENPEQDLHNMIGLISVKEKIEEMSARMEFEAHSDKKHSSHNQDMMTRHMCFYGNPGTGKTTVARIVTGFLFKNGYIKKNKCIEVDGNFLKAGTDTATKTEWLIRESFDGVLFIDEAYALLGSIEGDTAIATLIKQMEDNRGRFILILAGYTEEMQQLLNANPGFKSRIKEYLFFPDYSDEEMYDIFCQFAYKHSFVLTADTKTNFMIRLKAEKQNNSFGNGRTARNILEECIDKHAYNIKTNKIKNPEDKYKLLDIDVPLKPKTLF